jgi:hypothetical protein
LQAEGKQLQIQLGTVSDQCVMDCKCTVVIERGNTYDLGRRRNERLGSILQNTETTSKYGSAKSVQVLGLGMQACKQVSMEEGAQIADKAADLLLEEKKRQKAAKALSDQTKTEKQFGSNKSVHVLGITPSPEALPTRSVPASKAFSEKAAKAISEQTKSDKMFGSDKSAHVLGATEARNTC